MKFLMIITSVTTSLLLMFTGCSKEETVIYESEALTAFTRNYSKRAVKLNFEYLRKETTENGSEFVSIPLMEGEDVVGRFVEINGEGFFIDLSNYSQSVSISDVNDSKKTETFPTFHDRRADVYRADVAVTSRGWCEAGCIAAAIAIAFADGPSPVADYIAATLAAICIDEFC